MMLGIVIHMGGRIRRSIRGRGATGRLSVVPIMPAALAPGEVTPRPVRFVFYDGDRQLASSTRVLLARGKRYPGVEHWFVIPDTERGDDDYASRPESSANAYV